MSHALPRGHALQPLPVIGAARILWLLGTLGIFLAATGTAALLWTLHAT